MKRLTQPSFDDVAFYGLGGSFCALFLAMYLAAHGIARDTMNVIAWASVAVFVVAAFAVLVRKVARR